jgi:hypothetical protein
VPLTTWLTSADAVFAVVSVTLTVKLNVPAL